jgi:cell division protein FtsL
MSQPWYSPQTANHLIWATAVVLLALIALAGLVVWTRHKDGALYARLASEENARQAKAAERGVA